MVCNIRKPVLIAISMIMLILLSFTLSEISASVQRSFVLDLNNALFLYEENSLNDSSLTVEHDFNWSNLNVTYWIQIPKNSTILNATLNVTGKITYIYKRHVESGQLYGLSIYPVQNASNDITLGSSTYVLWLLNGTTGNPIWSNSSFTDTIWSTSIGNITSDPGNEIALGTNNGHIYLIDSNGNAIWSNTSILNAIYSVKIGNLYDSNDVFVVAGSDDNKIYVFNSDGSINWSLSLGNSVRSIDVGNLTADAGNEIVAACSSGNVFIINSSGFVVSSTSIGTSTLNSVAIGNVTPDYGNEIAIAATDGMVYILNSTLSVKWSYSVGQSAKSVAIGDVITDYEGNEVVFGSQDKNVYTLTNTGNLIWNFVADDYVNSISTGDITADTGTEVAAGTRGGYLYSFNFDYFPTNLTLDVGANGTADWTSPYTKLRNTTTVSGIASAIQYYIDNVCTTDLCDVPLLFNTSWPGRLNISDINITYFYNASPVIQITNISAWSRTSGIMTNESVGNLIKNVTFAKQPDVSITVGYIKMPANALSCDFNGTHYSNSTHENQNVCNIPDFSVSYGDWFTFWDSTMPSSVPVKKSESEPYYTTSTDNFYSTKNITVWNETPVVFYSITSNTTLESSVLGYQFLKVYWNSSWHNITPSSEDSGCDGPSPSYQDFYIGQDMFRVCRKGNFFKWVQPRTDGETFYKAGGSTNLPPVLSNENVTPSSALWGEWFNFSVQVNDTNNDDVNVTLWVYENTTSVWVAVETKNISGGNAFLWFNTTLGRNFSGQARYKFEYQDFNSSTGYAIHSPANTTEIIAPYVERHNATITHSSGNESVVNRTETVLLSVFINDTDISQPASGVPCTFWITTDGENFDSGFSNTTNESGYCNYYFMPNASYEIGNQTWKAGFYSNPYYNDVNSSDFVLTIKGKINISIFNPRDNQSLRRNHTNILTARLTDQFGNPVELQGYNCTFWIDNTLLGYNDTNSSGECIYRWAPDCTYPLGEHEINVTLAGPSNENYTIYGNNDHSFFYLKGQLVITVSEPQEYLIYHKGESVTLEASVNDTCKNCSDTDYVLTWYKKYKQRAVINIRDISGINVTNRVFIINGSEFLNNDIYFNDWLINNTRVMLNGNEIASNVYPWNDSERRTLNSSQQYMGQNAEIVFVSDLPAYGNKTFEIWYNTSRHIHWNTEFIRNGGFEGGSSDWDCSQTSCGGFCSCGIVQSNGPEGNYSYKLSAKAIFTNNAVTLTQNLTSDAGHYIKIVYNLTGDFSSGSYISLLSDTASCELNTSTKNEWVSQLCYNETSFSGKIQIILHDVGNGGSSNIYIDYICIANSSGDCVTHHAGDSPQLSFTSEDTIGTGNTTWQTTTSDAVGLRRLVANASGTEGSFRLDAKEDVYIYLYGWSEISDMNITQGGGCTYGATGFKCAQAANVTSWCRAVDANTSAPVYNLNVSFYGDGNYIGSNLTNETGVAIFIWQGSTTEVGNHTIVCNITDDPLAYYNTTENNSLSTSFIVSNGTTSGQILLNPYSINATGITTTSYFDFTLGINITNTGVETMLSPSINISTPAGITSTDVSCGDIPPQSYCYRESHISVGADADTGNNNISITVTWDNFKQGSTGNTTNTTLVFVVNNTFLFINKTLINATLSAGSTNAVVGSFVIENLGNVKIPYISIYEVGGNISNMTGWINYSQSEITNLPKYGNTSITVSVTIPGNATEGLYRTNITANATSSACSPETNCYDTLLLELNVTPFDWNIDRTTLSKTVGLNSQNGTIGYITLTNYKETNYTISTSITDSDYITISQSYVNLPAHSTTRVYVYHNSSGGYVFGNYTANITLTNQNGGLPHQRNITIMLEVINFTVRIVSPNATNPSGVINTSAIRAGSSQYINITVNATWQSSFLPDNVTWQIEIGGRACNIVSNISNQSDHLWHINCTVPDIPANPITADLVVIGRYTTQGVSISDTETGAIRYDDITPPTISSISSINGDSEGNVRYSNNIQYLLFNVIATDNTGVQSVSANVTYLENQTSVYTGSLQWLYGNTWRLNFTNPNWQGDYKIIITATDSSSHHWENTTTNTSIGYFDVYVPINFTGQFNDALGNPLDIDFEFYKPGTSWRIHSFSTNSSGGSKREIHRRAYDIKARVFGSTITFRSVNFSSYNYVSNPFAFDDVEGDLSNMGLPNSAETGALTAIAVNTSNITFSDAGIVLNYSGINNLQNYDESKFRVYVCDSWNFNSRTCSSTLSYLSSSYTQDVSANTFSFSVPHFSAYAIAKACLDSNGDPVACSTGGNQNSGGTTTGGGGSSGGGGGSAITTPPSTVPPSSTTTPFTIKTGISNINMHPGENRTYPMIIKNRLDRPLAVDIEVSEIGGFIVPEKTHINISASGNQTVKFYVRIPASAGTGTYTGLITVSAEGKSQEIPVTLSVTYEGTSYLSLDVKLITPSVTRDGDVKFSVIMRNTGLKKKFNVTLLYTIREGDTDYIIKQQNETVVLENDISFTRKISLKGLDVSYGEYVLEVMALFEDKSVREIEVFKVAESFWETPFGSTLPWIILLTTLIVGGYYARKKYIKWKLEKARYLFPLDYRKIPQETPEAFKIGKIAETDHIAWFNPKDLTTHMIVAGSTGAGKSVSASVFAEEALEHKIPVVVFDPTAQWTGFVKACTDENLLMYYPMFGMDTRDAHPYKGMIFEITDPQDLLFELKKGFKRYLNPGEITVFTLNKLKPGQYDEAVQYIIDALFSISWEESTELKLIIIFDEVHRLLEKYGGKGGYISLEKAAREFRKWGIGMIMCSQVLADFKEAIAGNVLTEIQLNTKSITDIQKVESKYGAEYARRISRQGIGVGMLQNPKYNDGKPYFVHFRPTYHNPHKITNEEMEIYKEFAKRLEVIEAKIEQMRKQKQDVFDIELELKLAKDKLKQGRFRMAKIYITSLEQHLSIR